MYQLKRLRESYGVSRKLLSKITGIPYRTLQNWELGIRELTEYEYRNIDFRLSERKELLNLIMSRKIKVKKSGCRADWFSDQNGYGCITDILGNKHKIYCDIEVRYSALEIIPVWAEWMAEELIEDVLWKEVAASECIQADA